MPWLAVGYPVLAHLGVWLHNLYLEWLALVWLLFSMTSGALLNGKMWAWVGFIGGSAALYFLTLHGNGIYALYLPPIAIPIFILWLFGRSLRSGATPLVSQFAEAMRGEPLPDVLRAYTRRVTQLWCVVAVCLTLSAVGTALWATPEIWSLVTNVLHYFAMGAVFVLEFAYRKIRYSALEPWGLMQYLRRLRRIRLRI